MGRLELNCILKIIGLNRPKYWVITTVNNKIDVYEAVIEKLGCHGNIVFRLLLVNQKTYLVERTILDGYMVTWFTAKGDGIVKLNKIIEAGEEIN